MSTQAERQEGVSERETSAAFPPGIPFIVGNEGAERFSYYGMRAILKTYLAALYLHFMATEVVGEAAARAASSKATAVTHLFMAGVYAFPMIGAIFADRLFGKYPIILFVSLIYCAGHGVLAIAGHFASGGNWALAEYGFYVGLVLIALGSGGIKPCVSANVGDQFTEKNKKLVTTIFQIFYFIINFGSFFSTILTPILKDTLGPEVAFGVPGIFMGIATIVFWFGRKRLIRVPPKPGGKLGLMDAASSTLLFSPIIALIAAVFVVSHGFQAPGAAGLGKLEFYRQYVTEYVSYLATHSWYFFAIGAVLFALGIGLFLARQKREQDTGFLAMLLYAFRSRRERRPGQDFYATVRERFGEDVAAGPPAVLRILVVFSMVSVFWALFDQHASTWITQATKMNLTLSLPLYLGTFAVWGTVGLAAFGGIWLFSWVANRSIPRRVTAIFVGLFVVSALGCIVADVIAGEWKTVALKAEQIQSLNPLMVMIIIPSLNLFVYRPLGKRGITIKPLQKMTIGMFLAAVAFALAALLQARIEAVGPGEVHVLWQAMQYVVMTTAEVLVSVTGLEFAYTQAPRTMKSTIMGFWLLGVTFGNVLVAFLAPTEAILSLSDFFWLFTALMTMAALAFSVLAYFYKGRAYLQG